MFKPLLSHLVESIDNVHFPVLASPKLDGIRCIIRDGVPVSRKLKPIRNAFIKKRLTGTNDHHQALLNLLDGELIVGSPTHPECFKKSTSGVMSGDGEPDFIFYVFDIVQPGVTFSVRYNQMRRNVEALRWAGFPVCEVLHTWINDRTELRAYEEAMVLRGYEGVMIRSPNKFYKFGRSTEREGTLGKVVRRFRKEAKITGFIERMHNANEKATDALGHSKRSKTKAGLVGRGDLGALEMVDEAGIEFEIGTGFSDAERAEIWNNQPLWLGRAITFEFRERTPDQSYRFPAYIGPRHKDDM